MQKFQIFLQEATFPQEWLKKKDTGERFEKFMRMVLPEMEETSEKAPEVAIVEKPELSAPRETESSIEASGVGSYSAEFTVENENLSTDAARELTTELINTIKAKVLELNPEFVGHIKLFLDNGSETVKQSVTIYYEEPQEDIIKSEEGAVPKLKILSAVSNVEKGAVKDAVNRSVQEVFERKKIEVNKTEPGHAHGHGHHEHNGHKDQLHVQRVSNVKGRKD